MAMATSSLATSTTSRLRKTFKYPSDMDPDDDGPSDLDEEEQESLINSLSTSNESANTLYTRIFTGLPLLGTLPFLWTLVTAVAALPSREAGGGGGGGAAQLGAVFLPCLLGVTSLALSAMVVGFVPLDGGGGSANGGDGDGMGRGTLSDIAHSQAARRHATFAGRGGMLGLELPFCVPVDAHGPVARYAMVLNGVLGVWMAVFAVMLMDSVKVAAGFWLLCLLPGVMAVVVFVVRGAMRDAERGLGELRGLRYGYKGA